MQVFETMAQGDYEQLVVCVDRAVGLRALIAVHDTSLGPALGGCRIWSHPDEDAALTDALRLARAMSYKNAAAGLHLGGGKALIWTDPRTGKSEPMLRSFSRFVESLGGRYITTEDVGSTSEDMVTIRQGTSHVVGLPTALGGSGDPSKATGYGIFRAMHACVQHALGTDTLKGMTVAMQGFGKVATFLAGHLLAGGATVVATDIAPHALRRAREMGCTVVEDPEAIYDTPCQVFAPCALGGTINPRTIPRLKCPVVLGAANNQLLTPEDGEALHQRGILYGPDYIANAGGVINLSFEIGSLYREEAAMERVSLVQETMAQVIRIAVEEGISTARAADSLAERRILGARKPKPIYRGGSGPK